MRPSIAVPLALWLAAATLASPCARAQTVSLQRGGSAVTIAVGEAAELPHSFPQDVFVPASSRLQRVETPADGRVMLEFADDATPEALDAAYAAAMAAAGWRRARVRAVEGARVQAWEQDARAVLVAITGETGGTLLRLQLVPRIPAAPAR